MRPEFDAALCALRYEWPLDSLVTRFKYGADLAVGHVLASVMAQQITLHLVNAASCRPQLLIPIPLHPVRLRERGFNQALELARPLSHALGIAMHAEGLRRVRATPRQTGLNALNRRRNVRGAFVPNTEVHDRHIALVDDVITTAATARECAKVLKRAGAASVQVWAVARAGVARM